MPHESVGRDLIIGLMTNANNSNPWPAWRLDFGAIKDMADEQLEAIIHGKVTY